MRRALRYASLALAAFSLFLGACSESTPGAARAVVVQFCDDVAAGRIEQARALLVESERSNTSRQLQQEGLRDGYEVSDERTAGDHRHVDVTAKSAKKPVTFVLVRAGADWRINLDLSMNLTHGAQLEYVKKTIDEAGKQMVERFQKTLAEQLQQSQGAPPADKR